MNGNRIRLEIKRLQNEVEFIGGSENDKTDREAFIRLRDEIIRLKQKINQMSNELSRYDLEHYSKDIRSLLKIVQKQMLTFNDQPNNNKKKILYLKRKPKFCDVINNRKLSNMTPLNSITTKTVNEKVIVSDNVSILQNLKHCQISSSSIRCNDSKDISGFLTLSQISETRIVLLDLPFTKGNIFITDCINCIMIIQVPPKDTVQLRLHNLLNCKIKISLKEPITSKPDKQTVVIENIKDCLFDITSKSIMTIENFGNIDQRNKEDKDYFFGEFNFSAGLDPLS